MRTSFQENYPAQLEQDLHMCRALTQAYAKSFSAGIRCFPERIRDQTYALYAFVRVPDNLVDEGNPSDEQARKLLREWEGKWDAAVGAQGMSDEPVLRAMYWLTQSVELDPAWIEAFFTAMRQDTEQKAYKTYEDLEGYMYGSATVVGYMMARICGAEGEEALVTSRALAEAFQLTNFLRDVDADYQERGRVYLPEDGMARYGIGRHAIEAQEMSPEFKNYMIELIAQARQLYRVGRSGIPLLDADCRFGVSLAADIYEAILTKIEQADYNVFTGRVRTSTLEKLLVYGKLRLQWRNAS